MRAKLRVNLFSHGAIKVRNLVQRRHLRTDAVVARQIDFLGNLLLQRMAGLVDIAGIVSWGRQFVKFSLMVFNVLVFR